MGKNIFSFVLNQARNWGNSICKAGLAGIASMYLAGTVGCSALPKEERCTNVDYGSRTGILTDVKDYLVNRGNDLIDPFKFKIGFTMGTGAKVKATDALWIGLLTGQDVNHGIGIDGRNPLLWRAKDVEYYYGFCAPQIISTTDVIKGKRVPLDSFFATYSEGCRGKVTSETRILIPRGQSKDAVVDKLFEKLGEDWLEYFCWLARKGYPDLRESFKGRMEESPEVKTPTLRFEEEYAIGSRFLGRKKIFETGLYDFPEENFRDFLVPSTVRAPADFAYKGTKPLDSRSPIRWLDLEAGAGFLPVGIEAGFSPGEALDAILGFIPGVDMGQDDKKGKASKQ